LIDVRNEVSKIDIDIDCSSDFISSEVFPTAVRASLLKEGKLSPHPCGIYFQDVPTDPLSGLSAIPYEQAESLGCFKIDFLHVHVYDHFTSRDEIKELLKHDPDWELLQIPSVVQQLFQISKHHELLIQLKPRSIIELADFLALIRPQKRYLKDLYLRNKDEARKFLYTKEPGSGYGFKKGHSVAYSLTIVLQLHLIKGGISF
jgi:DNA polymerase III alpha subunit